MRMIQATILFALCLALFSGVCWARGTTVSVGETVPLGGTTTTTTTTTNTTTTHNGSSGTTPQVQITPADGSTPSSTEGSGWENLGVVGGGDSGTSGSGASGTDATGGSTAGTGATSAAQQNSSNQGTGSGCAPALVLAGIGLSLFIFRN